MVLIDTVEELARGLRVTKPEAPRAGGPGAPALEPSQGVSTLRLAYAKSLGVEESGAIFKVDERQFVSLEDAIAFAKKRADESSV